MGLPCMNCKQPAEPAQVFAECHVCADCFRVASRVYDQAQHEAQLALGAMRSLLRTAIVQGRLSLPMGPEQQDTRPKDLPRAIEQIAEMLKCRPSPHKTPLTESSKPSAPTAPELRSSSSTWGPSKSETPSLGTEQGGSSESA